MGRGRPPNSLYNPSREYSRRVLFYLKGDEDVAKKKSAKKTDEQKKSTITASHLMLYIILGVYIVVALSGLILIGLCISNQQYEYIAQVFISEISMVSGCSGVSVGFYANKAKRENELQISNAKYKMRLDLAKEIYNSNGVTLDDKSVQLLRMIMSDKDIQIDEEIKVPPTEYLNVVSGGDATGLVQGYNSNGIDSEGVG